MGAATAPRGAAASGLDLFGLGARASALGGSDAALCDGYDATYENPAGLAQVTGRRLTLGYVYGHFELSINDVHDRPDDTHATVVGAELPLPLRGALRDRLVLGLSFFSPIGVVTRSRVPDPYKPSLILLEDRTQVVGVNLALGIHLLPRLDVGAGVLALAALVGDIHILADSSGRVAARSEQQLVADFAPIVGITWRPEMGDIALVYRGVSQATYDVHIDNNLADQFPLGLPKLRLHGVAQYDPAQVTLEAAWRTLPRVRIVTGATWKRWSDYPGLAEPPTTKSTPPPQSILHDTFVGRLAFERRIGERNAVRGGYAYELTPIDTKPSNSVQLDNDRHIFGVGLGSVLGPLRLDGFFQWHLLVSTAHSQGNIVVAGLTVGVELQ